MRTPHTSLARAPVPASIAARPRSRSGRAAARSGLGSRGDQDPGNVGVARDVAGEGLREVRPLEAGSGERVDARVASSRSGTSNSGILPHRRPKYG